MSKADNKVFIVTYSNQYNEFFVEKVFYSYNKALSYVEENEKVYKMGDYDIVEKVIK